MSKTTTSQYQKKPDYFPSAEECAAAERKRVNTNPRYKFFNQTHFTAGDMDQFEQYRDATNGRVCIPDIDLSQNRFKNIDMSDRVDWEKYRGLDAMSVNHTFNYLFNKFKKGVFLKIKDGKLAVFLPFSKTNFTNEWSRRIHIDPKYGDLLGFIRYIQNLEGRRFIPNRVNRFIDSWYSNNCLVRYEFPVGEGDTNNPNMSDMFATLCAERELPDMEFFVNRRDFPLLKTDGTEPYSHMYDTSGMKLLSHDYDKYCPILSMVTSKNYADIPIPTGDDWARVMRAEGKYFPRTCNRSFEMKSVPWADRKPIAVFRGGSSGCGVTIQTNPRLKLAYLSKTTPKDSDGLPLLDAGITNWNLRPRKIKGQKYLQTINIKSLPFGLVDRLTPQEQSTYKYIVNVDGHVAAYRLSLELSSGACILLAASKYKMWYHSMLKPWVHFVPVKSDLSDLIDKIKWCKQNDDKCEAISINAMEFARTYLTKEGILDYLQKLLYDLKKVNGVYLYNSISLLDLQFQNERSLITQSDPVIPTTDKTLADLTLIPSQRRSYGLLQGIEWIINKVMADDTFTNVATKGPELFNNRLSVITEYELAGYSLVQKSTLEKSRHKEIVHETFVTTKVTNELLKQIPNFVYVFGMYEDTNGINVLIEHIKGQTFNQYIHSKQFNIQDFCLILIQLGLALHVAQRTCGLVHYDLTPWNIMIQRLPHPVEFDYIIDHKTVYRVKTQIVPVIIDMGRSHVIYRDNHYGIINMFQTSTVQDIVTLLVTSVYEVSKLERIPRDTVSILITLANFLSGTRYRRKRFTATGRGGLGDIRFFFRKAKKYSELVTRKKYDLENKNPLDFVHYIMKNIRQKFPVKVGKQLFYHMNHGNARQVFDYSFCSSDEERALTFAKVFHRVKQCRLPDPTNLLLVYYTAQSLYDSLNSVYNIMTTFLNSVDIDSAKYVKKYKQTLKHIKKKYQTVLAKGKQSPIEYSLKPVVNISYHAHTFLFPEKVLKLLSRIEDEQIPDEDLVQYKEVIEQTLLHASNLPYTLPPEIRQYYTENFSDLLAINSVRRRDSVASVISLRDTASMIYSKDSSTLNTMKDENGDCQQVKDYQRVYRKILQLLVD